MRNGYARRLTLVLFAAVQIFLNAQAHAAMQYYKLSASLKIGGAGRWDYVTLDAAGRLLYVTRSTHTMVVGTYLPAGR